MSRLCPAHGKELKKTVDMSTGETYWYCSKQRCGYRENEKGERI